MSPRSTALTMGFRRCYRRPNVHHGVRNLECDCLRVEIPVEARAKSFGRLATDFEGMARGARVARATEAIEEAFPGFGEAWKAAEKRALRSGGKPRSFSKKTTETSTASRAAGSDRSIRSRLSKDRASGRIGRRS